MIYIFKRLKITFLIDEVQDVVFPTNPILILNVIMRFDTYLLVIQYMCKQVSNHIELILKRISNEMCWILRNIICIHASVSYIR